MYVHVYVYVCVYIYIVLFQFTKSLNIVFQLDVTAVLVDVNYANDDRFIWHFQVNGAADNQMAYVICGEWFVEM